MRHDTSDVGDWVELLTASQEWLRSNTEESRIMICAFIPLYNVDTMLRPPTPREL
jgi:hypothetical protein